MATNTNGGRGEPLTPAQQRVRELLSLGLSDGQIASELGIRRRTVEAHVSEIIGRLGVRNRHEAASWPERPPWWLGALTPVALFWRRAAGSVPAAGSSAAAAAAGLSFMALAGLGLIAILLLRGGGEPPALQAVLDAMAAEGAPLEEMAVFPPPAPSAQPPPAPPPAPALASRLPLRPAEADESDGGGDPAQTAGDAPSPTPCPPDGCDTLAAPLTVPSTPPPPPTVEATATPPPSNGVMAVDCDASRPGVQSFCAYPGGTTFAVQVHVVHPPARGYVGFSAELGWQAGFLAYLPSQEVREEIRWETCDSSWNIWDPPGTSQVPPLVLGCVPGRAEQYDEVSNFRGPVLEYELQCRQQGVTPVTLIRGGGTFLLDLSGYIFHPERSDSIVGCGPCRAKGCPTPDVTPTATGTREPVPTRTPTPPA